MELSGRQVLLTGATGGLGQAIARRLHGAGARLILTGRRTDVLEPLAREVGARSLAVDLSQRSAVQKLITEGAEVDILIANAALPASGPLDSFSVPEIDRALEVNLRAPIILAQGLAERMRSRGEGHLLFMSSLAGKAATSNTSLYNATKFGLRGFALALRAELANHGVGVSLVYPGFIRDAGMFADSGAELPKGVGTKTPEEVADGVVRAIEGNRAEVDVAPIALRAGAVFGGLAPEVAARLSRRMGSEKLGSDIEAGQRDKR
ncbi:MAG TPA: SDR family NAD(P)-dependent oxidoreductase [Solirubrobacteraceae bacterium]|jgi:short-subunit dehydrogenase|nr:SDR family NAD(P)-dependent oxidoreductase [Solirubrobacteraceae bacterium]